MIRIAVAGIVVAGLALWPIAGAADDVQIKVIDPARPNQPGEPAKADPFKPADPAKAADPTGPADSPKALLIRSGDWVLDAALQQLKLPAADIEKVNELLEPASKQVRAIDQEYASDWRRIQAQMREAQKGDDPATRPDVAGLSEQWRKGMEAYGQKRRELRGPVVDKLAAVLSPEQADKLRKAVEQWNDDPKAIARRAARQSIDYYAPGVQLTARQQEQLTDLFVERQEQMTRRWREQSAATADLWPKAGSGDEQARKQMQAINERSLAESRAAEKATRAAVEQILTPDQRTAVAAVRREQTEKWIRNSLDWTVKSFHDAELTEEQKQKAGGLAEKTLQTLLQSDEDDWSVRLKAAGEFAKVIEGEVLTPEQRQKRADARREQTNQWLNSTLGATAKAYERLGLTDEQKRKINDLSAAARDAGGSLSGDDWNGRVELIQQFTRDIQSILTDEQKQKFKSSGVYGSRGEQQ